METRVGGWEQFASGQTSVAGVQSPENAMGLRVCAYKTASGRLKWLNQDPIEETDGSNLYGVVGNDPINNFDLYGLWWGQGLFNSFGDLELSVLGKMFVGGGGSAGDPSSQGVLAQRSGWGWGTLDDGNGNTISLNNAAMAPIQAGGKPLIQAGMLLTPIGDEEEGAGLGAGLWNALKNKLTRSKCEAKVPNFKELEVAWDAAKNKVHGVPLPNPNELNRYHPEDLEQLLGDLQKSVQTRTQEIENLGSNIGHDARLAEEQELIQAITKYLGK